MMFNQKKKKKLGRYFQFGIIYMQPCCFVINSQWLHTLGFYSAKIRQPFSIGGKDIFYKNQGDYMAKLNVGNPSIDH